MKHRYYLDYNATCPIRPAVIETVAAVMAETGNPSSVHSAGRHARSRIEEARSKIAALVGARARDIVFCSGGTEANNTVIKGAGAASLIVSALEHESVLAASAAAGLPAFSIKAHASGQIDLGHLEQLLKDAPAPALISVMLANNETGVIQPVASVSALAKQYGAILHTDAIQAAGKITIDQQALGADYITLSSHKVGGPQGVGAIVLTPKAPLKPLVTGGGQELGRRSGTENVAGIAGFGVAAFEALVGLADQNRIQMLRDRLEAGICKIANQASIIAAESDRLPNTSCLVMPEVKGETQVMHFDLAGVCLSSGSACSSGKVKVSHVLSAMGYEDATANASIRASIGYQTTEADIDAFLAAWQALYARTHQKAVPQGATA